MAADLSGLHARHRSTKDVGSSLDSHSMLTPSSQRETHTLASLHLSPQALEDLRVLALGQVSATPERDASSPTQPRASAWDKQQPGYRV